MKQRMIVFLLMLATAASAQESVNAELYYYPGSRNAALVPVAGIQLPKNWATAVHYNWEDDGIASLHFGRNWELGNSGFTLRPMGGVLFGRYTGLSVLTEAEWEKGNWYIYAAPQYCFSPGNPSAAFYYSWSEARYAPLPFLSFGLALQQTVNRGEALLNEPGVLLSLSKGRFELPLYRFRSRGEGYWVVALMFNWERKKNVEQTNAEY